ncbi:19261_t:CDS:2, partial [Gigaspora rosea]
MDIYKGESSYKKDKSDLQENNRLYIYESNQICGHKALGSKLFFSCLTNVNFYEITEDKNYGECPRCKYQNNGKNWCNSCANDIYISTLSKEISDHVHSPGSIPHELNKRSTSVKSFFEYIPEVRVQNKKLFAKGGCSEVYTAEWLDGNIESIGFDICDAEQVSRSFGLTVNSSGTIAVMKLFKERNILHNDFDDFHKAVIADFGASSFILKKMVQQFQKTFTIKMYELVVGNPTFSNKSHNKDLALKIWKGPLIPKEIPAAYANLIIQCWDSNLKKLPSSTEVTTILLGLS